MAPKKLAAMASSDSEESIEVKPKAKRKVGKVKNEKEGKKPAAKKAKTVVLTQPETRDDGWTLHPPSLIYRFEQI
jgi:tRNA U54 and U55 pseudouridine synthase Pus10